MLQPYDDTFVLTEEQAKELNELLEENTNKHFAGWCYPSTTFDPLVLPFFSCQYKLMRREHYQYQLLEEVVQAKRATGGSKRSRPTPQAMIDSLVAKEADIGKMMESAICTIFIHWKESNSVTTQTGFFVSPSYIMTSWHGFLQPDALQKKNFFVKRPLTIEYAVGSLTSDYAEMKLLDKLREAQLVDDTKADRPVDQECLEAPLDSRGVAWVPRNDMALLKTTTPSTVHLLPSLEAPGDDDIVATIGYPTPLENDEDLHFMFPKLLSDKILDVFTNPVAKKPKVSDEVQKKYLYNMEIKRTMLREIFKNYSGPIVSVGMRQPIEFIFIDELQLTMAPGMSGGPVFKVSDPTHWFGLVAGTSEAAGVTLAMTFKHPAVIYLYKNYIVNDLNPVPKEVTELLKN